MHRHAPRVVASGIHNDSITVRCFCLYAQYAKAADDLKSGLDEFRSLKTTKASAQLEELEQAVAAEREAERAAVDALRQQLDDTRARLESTTSELRSLKERPPPPSESLIRSTDLFRRADGEASKWRGRA